MFHRPCFTEIDLHEKSGGVPDTDPHPRKKKRIKEQRSKETESYRATGVAIHGVQVKILTRTMKVKSEHHKVSGSSSAKAHRVRAANLNLRLPSHRLSAIQRSEVVRSAGGKLSPIGYSCHRKPASINETIIYFSQFSTGSFETAWLCECR
jgi:hypothetical protein